MKDHGGRIAEGTTAGGWVACTASFVPQQVPFQSILILRGCLCLLSPSVVERIPGNLHGGHKKNTEHPSAGRGLALCPLGCWRCGVEWGWDFRWALLSPLKPHNSPGRREDLVSEPWKLREKDTGGRDHRPTRNCPGLWKAPPGLPVLGMYVLPSIPIAKAFSRSSFVKAGCC